MPNLHDNDFRNFLIKNFNIFHYKYKLKLCPLHQILLHANLKSRDIVKFRLIQLIHHLFHFFFNICSFNILFRYFLTSLVCGPCTITSIKGFLGEDCTVGLPETLDAHNF
jgi:hypothetical protein